MGEKIFYHQYVYTPSDCGKQQETWKFNSWVNLQSLVSNYRNTLTIPNYEGCARQQNTLTVLSGATEKQSNCR